jgi:hypothetical protein
LTHRHVDKPISRKDLPRIWKIGKYALCALPVAASGYALPRKVESSTTGENMKKTILKIVVTTLLLLALGASSAVADGVPLPGCYPRPCQVQ